MSTTNLPARTPVRARSEVAKTAAAEIPAVVPVENRPPILPPLSLPSLTAAPFTVDRRCLTQAVRFAARVASRAPIQSLRGCLFVEGALVATDLDVSLRARIQGCRDLGALVPAEPLKRSVFASQKPIVEITRLTPVEVREFAVNVDGAILEGSDPREFPDPRHLFPEGEPRAHGLFGSLEPVLVATAVEDERKALNAVYFECCRNVVLGTDSHRLHMLGIESGQRGDFLVPRKAIELVEDIRRATRSTEAQADFFEHQAVFYVGNFDVAARLETETFPAYEEVIPKSSRHELRIQKTALLEALDRIAAVLNDRSRGVRLRRVPDGLEISGRKSGAGEITIMVAASGWEEGATLGLNLGYLSDAARFVRSEELTIGLTDENTPIRIVDGLYLALVMPIRLTKGEIP